MKIAGDGTIISRTSSLVACTFSLIEDEKGQFSEGASSLSVQYHFCNCMRTYEMSSFNFKILFEQNVFCK